MRMAKADGSFKIAKFALGDDEVNYNLYEPRSIRRWSPRYKIFFNQPVFEPIVNNTLCHEIQASYACNSNKWRTLIFIFQLLREMQTGWHCNDNAETNIQVTGFG